MKTIRPSFKSFKEKALKNPEINAEYEALKPIFELKKQMIQARLAANLTQEDVANLLHTKKKQYFTLLEYAKAVGFSLEINFRKNSFA